MSMALLTISATLYPVLMASVASLVFWVLGIHTSSLVLSGLMFIALYYTGSTVGYTGISMLFSFPHVFRLETHPTENSGIARVSYFPA